MIQKDQNAPSPGERSQPASGAKPNIPPELALDPSESERFLGFMFWEVAVVPRARLTLKNTPPVVRYLLWLASQGVPKSIVKDKKAIERYGLQFELEAGRPCRRHRRIRAQTEKLARSIWGDLLLEAMVTPAAAGPTRKFLKDFELPLQAYPEFKAACEMIDEFAVPADSKYPFQPHSSISQHSRTTGGKAYRDDLLERIYAAHHALVGSGIEPAARLVAGALNDQKSRFRQSKSEPRTWDEFLIMERIKSFDRGLRTRFRKPVGSTMSKEALKERVRSRKAQIVNKWLFRFRPLPKAKH